MKRHSLKGINKIGSLAFAIFAMTGCMGTLHLSEGITNEGHVEQKNIIFPEIEDAWQQEGIFPNRENLKKIKSGVTKDDLYYLIGRPHFDEAHKAREWDYIMKFYQEDESIKVCQYKVIFDKDYIGREFYWKPNSCPPPVNAPTMPIKESIKLGADALFKFDEWKLGDILPQGRRDLKELAQKLREYQQLGDTRIIITGHTDYKGDDSYNMNLSLLRAQTVRTYLVNQGVDPSSMLATGAGESQPVSQCPSNLSLQQEIECLQPNRRVTLDVTVTK